jgi:hypothetical protein
MSMTFQELQGRQGGGGGGGGMGAQPSQPPSVVWGATAPQSRASGSGAPTSVSMMVILILT